MIAMTLLRALLLSEEFIALAQCLTGSRRIYHLLLPVLLLASITPESSSRWRSRPGWRPASRPWSTWRRWATASPPHFSATSAG